MRKVLLADDEAYVTSVLAAKLASRFDDVIIATDGDEAFDLAAAEGPVLVISDYQMPGCDGYTLATRLHDDPRTGNIPILLLTARGHLLSDEQLSRTNIRKLLAKPFSVREVIAIIDELLGTIRPAATIAAATSNTEARAA